MGSSRFKQKMIQIQSKDIYNLTDLYAHPTNFYVKYPASELL
jgi:hypothetical protein